MLTLVVIFSSFRNRHYLVTSSVLVTLALKVLERDANSKAPEPAADKSIKQADNLEGQQAGQRHVRQSTISRDSSQYYSPPGTPPRQSMNNHDSLQATSVISDANLRTGEPSESGNGSRINSIGSRPMYLRPGESSESNHDTGINTMGRAPYTPFHPNILPTRRRVI